MIQASDDYTVIRDERGRWLWAVCASASDLPTSGVPEGSVAWETDAQKLWAFISGAWASGPLTVGALTSSGVTADVTGDVTGDVSGLITSPKGATLVPFINEEEVDLGGADEGAAVATVADLIPAGAVVFGVSKRVTEAFAGDVANYDIGDESTSDRFVTNNTDLTLADTGVHNEDGVLAPEAAASKLEVLLDDAATAGKLRLAVFGLILTASTS